MNRTQFLHLRSGGFNLMQKVDIGTNNGIHYGGTSRMLVIHLGVGGKVFGERKCLILALEDG